MMSYVKFGEMVEFEHTTFAGEKWTEKAPYKYAEWGKLHTDDQGYGLWVGDDQIVGTCDFSVAGCKTEKAAIAKIRKWARDPRERR